MALVVSKQQFFAATRFSNLHTGSWVKFIPRYDVSCSEAITYYLS